MTSITLSLFKPPKPAPPVLSGTFGVVNPDYDQRWREEDVKDPKYSYHVSRVTRNGTAYWAKSKSGDPIGFGAPATARFVWESYVEFTEPFQRFLHEYCSKLSGQSENENKKSFASLFRDNVMMTDFAGTWTRADYINHNGKPPYIMLKPMVNGGALQKIVGETTIAREKHWLVEGITNENFAQYPPHLYPWLWFRPIISVRLWHFDAKGNIIKKEEYYAEPFPQYMENAILPVLGVKRDTRSSTGWINAIPAYRVRVLRSGQSVPNPFIMRFGRVKPNPYEGFVAP